MKKLAYIITALSFFHFASCDESSRKKAHEEVVQQERADNDALEGLDAQQEAHEIQVVVENMAYTPKEIRVQPGEFLRVQLINRDEIEHSIEFELPGGEQELEQNIKAGESGTLEFTTPQQAGTYTFYCPVDDHKEKGMTGTLIVE